MGTPDLKPNIWLWLCLGNKLPVSFFLKIFIKCLCMSLCVHMSFTYCVHVGALRGQEDAGCPGTGVTNSGESPNVGRVLPHSSGLSEPKVCVKINTPFLESVFSFFQWLKYHFFVCVLKTR